ncbi:hypothetical protein [Marinicellulosiphila megalodicopiae]|uniref:hypothetical protein n=1 Tax=Marinicellulosiphila megalodicopiae TaxID=2724896 RepID=UPI003BB14706
MDKHYSSSLATVLTQLVPTGGAVLDLGSMSSGTTEAFLQKKCRCYVEDLLDYLDDIHKTNAEPIAALNAHLLPKDASQKFNVILCWDLLNFLSLETISSLFETLKPHLQPGTLLHFIKYSGSKIPAYPKRFRLLQDFTFELYGTANDQSLISFPHSTIKLLKHLDLFSIRNTSMNQQGMQKDMVEYLLEFSENGSRPSAHGIKQSGLVSYFQSTQAQNVCEFHALNSLLDSVEDKSITTILDLGKNTNRSLEYLDNHCQKLLVEDVYSSMTWQRKLKGNNDDVISDGLLTLPNATSLDLVLIWDLFSYCSPKQFERLAQIIANKMQAGALLHLVMHRNKMIPENPATFEVMLNKQVNISGNLQCKNKNEFITITGLMKLLPQFKIKTHNTIRLNDDIAYQELLLQFTPNRTF